MKKFTLLNKTLFIVSLSMLLLSMKCGGANNKPAQEHHIAISSYFTEKQFNDLFPMRDKFYSYSAFIKAVNQIGRIKIKVVKRGVSIYQITRTDKSTGKSAVVRQDEDWNEDWAKKKPDSAYVIDYGNFCSEKDLATNKKELAAFLA